MSSLKIGLAGTAFGVVSGAGIALAVMTFVPELGHPPRLQQLSRDVGWALFFSSPVGFLTGGILVGYLQQRSRDVATFRRLIVECLTVAVVIAAVTAQLVIPSTWGLPRLRITAIMVVGAFCFAVIGSWVLKPLYWRR